MTARRDSGIKNEQTRRVDLDLGALEKMGVPPGFKKVEVTVLDSGIIGVVSLPDPVVRLYRTNRPAFDEALAQALESVKDDLLESARSVTLDA